MCVSILFRKLKLDKTSHLKADIPNQTPVTLDEKHVKDISTNKTPNISSASTQPTANISANELQDTSSTSIQLITQPTHQLSTDKTPSHSLSNLQTKSPKEIHQTSREITPSLGEVIPATSTCEILSEEQIAENELKKRRKDKTAMRKSQLNAGQQADQGETRV